MIVYLGLDQAKEKRHADCQFKLQGSIAVFTSNLPKNLLIKNPLRSRCSGLMAENQFHTHEHSPFN